MHELASISSSPRRIRLSNEVAALRALYRFGRQSRAELARALGLNRSSSGQIIAALIASGLVREVQEKETPVPRTSPVRAGRPGILLEIVPEAACFLGAEIGVEHITTVTIDLGAHILARRVEPFEGRGSDVKVAVAQAFDQAFAGLPADLVGRCVGIGLSAPAQMSQDGHIRVGRLLGWRDVSLADIARAALPLDVPVMVENDANAFAIGELHRRRNSLPGVTLYLVLESGVGAGIVIDGTLFRGGHGLAGEIGHLLVPGSDAELEQIIGRENLLERFRTITGDPGATFEAMLLKVRDRVPRAVEIGEDWARHLAFALTQACRLIDPQRVVLGGSVAALFPMVAARVTTHMRAMQAPSFPMPDVAIDEDAESGSAFGAACMLHQRFLSLENERFAEDGTRVETVSATDAAPAPEKEGTRRP